MEEVYYQIFKRNASLFRVRRGENLIDLVEIPEILGAIRTNDDSSFEKREQAWFAIHTIGFFEDVKVLYSLVEEFHVSLSTQGGYNALLRLYPADPSFPPFTSGFPVGFRYKMKIEAKVTGRYFIQDCFRLLNQFTEGCQRLLTDSKHRARRAFFANSFKYILRVYCILFSVCLPKYYRDQTHGILLSSFKHFYFFMKKHNLLRRESELKALQSLRLQSLVNLELVDAEYSSYYKILNRPTKPRS